MALAEGEELIAHVGILSLGVQRGIDGATKCSRAIVFVDLVGWGGLVVCLGDMISYCGDEMRSGEQTIGSRNHYMEVVSVLTLIGSLFHGHWYAPQCTFEVGSAWRVRAIFLIRIYSRITLAVNIECFTTIGLVAFGCTPECVKALQGVETHIIRSTQ